MNFNQNVFKFVKERSTSLAEGILFAAIKSETAAVTSSFPMDATDTISPLYNYFQKQHLISETLNNFELLRT